MKRRSLVRVQLLILLGLTLLIVVRAAQGPPEPEGLVVYTDLEPGELRHASLRVEAPTSIVVEAAGSLDGEALGAYGWVLRREDRSVAWALSADEARPEGSLVVRAQDTLDLTAGVYDVFYTSYGSTLRSHQRGSALDRIFKLSQHWTNDAEEWSYVLRPLRNGADVIVQHDELTETAPAPDHLLWTSAPMRGGRMDAYMFEVERPTTVQLYSIGELCDDPCDYGWIDNLVTGERVWTLARDNTVPAGGWDMNRLFEGDLLLPAGVYRVAFETDAGHAFRGWRANPPYDPAAWGLTMSAATGAEQVQPFDPWTTREPLLQITEVPNSTVRRAELRVVEAPLRVMVYAVGEMSGRGSVYDYGWIENTETGERVWEMDYEATMEAGGDDSNRAELAFVTLPPGTYEVAYQTDGSHAFGDWSSRTPDHPERWGVTLFPADPDPFDAANVEVRQMSEQLAMSEVSVAPSAPGDVPPPPPPPTAMSNVLIEHTRLDDEARIQEAFSLSEETTLQIYAVGEISISGRYDYGWIERADDGTTVWEMTWSNTQPAGGEERNRVFHGTTTLPAGSYVLHYRTDFSHAYGDFSGEPPQHPEAWGIRVAPASQTP